MLVPLWLDHTVERRRYVPALKAWLVTPIATYATREQAMAAMDVFRTSQGPQYYWAVRPLAPEAA